METKVGLKNCSKLVEVSLFAIIDLLIEAKFIILNFIWRMGMIFTKKTHIKKKNLYFALNLRKMNLKSKRIKIKFVLSAI